MLRPFLYWYTWAQSHPSSQKHIQVYTHIHQHAEWPADTHQCIYTQNPSRVRTHTQVHVLTCRRTVSKTHVHGGSSGKEPACQCRRHETWVQSLGREDPLEKEMATHSNILAWRIPWIEEPDGLQSTGLQKNRTWLKWLHTHTCTARKLH